MNMTSLLGRIATNFEVKQVNNTSVTNFILAVDTTRKDKEGNGYETAFLPIVIFGKNAENTYKHVAKGDKVCVTGELRSRAYKKNGTDVMVIEVIAKYIEFVRRSKANQQQSQNQNIYNDQQSVNQNEYNNQQLQNRAGYNSPELINQGGYYNQQQNQSGYQPMQNQGSYQQPVSQGNYQQQPQYQNLSGFDDNLIPSIADGDIPF
ncbi:single-stranded DNA-binding protein [Clostridium botulinum]|uniref:single-stranded DNA-binding protein n=1 Tax=Clostridium botulinum TaxID=1491 RepID=UPI001375B699|nr:single-stranded DNA-binding protein [Clostridium botulinum]NCI20645.1 single-stranded DNA-binding protein [Clostridium botulinum]NCI35353.1 single-stranded DNA-binding protein [Clostridium botulinum]NCI72054.1 single-stranded DNA-binding protein [Clostridium botulinum]NDI38168.1 single-stranded DNA-binding protein [Clostridium botulinum]